jgi:hypothetical protein
MIGLLGFVYGNLGGGYSTLLGAGQVGPRSFDVALVGSPSPPLVAQFRNKNVAFY